MILVYNVSGLVLGVIGVLAGFLMMILCGSMGAGLLALAVAWIGGGFWWRRRAITAGVQRGYPSIYFIPLPFLGIPLALLAIPLFFIEPGRHAQAADQRSQMFRADEHMLDSAAAAGDVPLSQSILTALQTIPTEAGMAQPFSVYTRSSGDSVLVLVKARNLKKYKDQTRKAMLQEIATVVRDTDEGKEKRLFTGIKGQLAFGAIEIPPGEVHVGSVVPESKLFAFYGDLPSAASEPIKANGASE